MKHMYKLYNRNLFYLIMDLKSEFYTDVIYKLCKELDSYPEYYAVGQILHLDSCEEINEQTLEWRELVLLRLGPQKMQNVLNGWKYNET